MVAALMEGLRLIDVREILPLVNTPTLILHRPGDAVISIEHGRYLAANIPNAKLVEISGTDHSPLVLDDGQHTAEIEQFVTGVRETREPDRVLATVMFTDICNSTQMASELGDAHWRELLMRHDALTDESIARFRGRRVKSTGDGTFATFDGPARAIRCARELQHELSEAGIQVRAGVHAGECEVIGDDLGGVGVHVGARIAALAGADELLVSSTVKDLVLGADFKFEDRGSHELKGLPGEWKLFAVSNESSGAGASSPVALDYGPPQPTIIDRGLVTALQRAPGAMRFVTRMATKRSS
jgi:class 3 adenylate cyclase